METGSGLFTVTVMELQPIHLGRVETQTQPSISPGLRRKLAQDSLHLHIPHPIALETPSLTGPQDKQICSDTLAHPSSQTLRRSRGVPDLRSQRSGNIEDASSIAGASSPLETHSPTTSISISDFALHEPTIEQPATIAIRVSRPVLVLATDARTDVQPTAKQRTRRASYRLVETTC